MPSDYAKTAYPGVYRRGDTLYFRVKTHSGQWSERKYGTGRPQDAARARQIAQESEDRVRWGVDSPHTLQTRQNASRRVTEHIGYFCLDRAPSRRATIRRVLTSWAGDRTLTQIDAFETRRWLESLPLAPATRAAWRHTVLSFCKWLEDTRRVDRRPLTPADLPPVRVTPVRRKNAMAYPDFQRLLACEQVPRRRRRWYAVAGYTGLRWAEIARMQVYENQIHVVGKNGRNIPVPVPADLLPWLDRLPYGRIPRAEAFARDLAAAGITTPDLHRSSLRVSYATWLAQAGVDLRTTQRLMRHSDPRLTANIYTRLSERTLSDAVNTISTLAAPTPHTAVAGTP